MDTVSVVRFLRVTCVKAFGSAAYYSVLVQMKVISFFRKVTVILERVFLVLKLLFPKPNALICNDGLIVPKVSN